MGEVVSFNGYTPPARFDAIPWADAKIEEAPTADGAWTLIDTIALTPVDADPSQPTARSFTTDDGTGPFLWYRITFVDAGTGSSQPTNPVQNGPAQPDSRDLCTLADVLRLVPGYVSESDTDETLQELITAESELVHAETNREIVAIPDRNPRVYDIDWIDVEDRELFIGDAATITSVTIKDCSGLTVPTGTYVELPRERKEWEPITSLWFRRDPVAGGTLAPGYTATIDAVWGFPVIPEFIVKAVAKRVLLRYITDVASKGTLLADAVDDVLPAALFASARDALNRIRIPGVG